MQKGSSMPITPIFHSLQWLPVSARIIYKISLLTFQCLHDSILHHGRSGLFLRRTSVVEQTACTSEGSTDPDTFKRDLDKG
ncbi:hypothetical protein CHARACLAT_005534 [Characodon lateralis]|uniref:Uncharacterized protein n=1 Tax=Characodon lateralis TaxID=208331 RepID=A0ABU7EGM3_9TELE|nr:hypothetical protein [Characodon lateralis]